MSYDLIPPTRGELLTAQFYQWEKRGRGWGVWSYPVELEPPFTPFYAHQVERPVVDDGRHKTFWSSFRQGLMGSEEQKQFPALIPQITDVEPEVAEWGSEIATIGVSLPANQKVARDAMEHFLMALSVLRGPLAFEVIGTKDVIKVQLACMEDDVRHVRQQLRAYFPEATLRQSEDFLQQAWSKTDWDSFIVDFGLSREFMVPLRVSRNFDVDSLIGITAALSELSAGEVGVFQVVLQRARNTWTDSVLRAVTDGDGRPFFADAPDLVSNAKQKIARPLFAAIVRIGALSSRSHTAREITRSVASALIQFSDPTGNELVPLDNEDYPDAEHETAFLGRFSYRSGMLLNLDELLSLVHFPSPSGRIEKLEREVKKTKAAPALAETAGVLLGYNVHNGNSKEVRLNSTQRVRHMYVIGGSGTGKSTLLLNLILQDIENGDGVGVLDPHGDLIDEILGRIPDRRMNDVVLVDPADEEHPVGFNILSAHSEIEKTLLSSDLVAVFRRLSTSWGDQMTSVLANAILAILESTNGGTLADLRRFLVEKDFREMFLKTVTDPEIVYYWHKEFPLLSGRPQASLLTRLDTFLRPKLIRYMVAQKENRLDFAAMMNERKIFLGKLAQGAIGEENSYLLGSFIVSKFHQMAMGRQELAASRRTPFYLYIDEFHNFMTPSMASILSGARKFNLGLIVSHQEFRQIWSRDTEVASAVISNPYTRVCFRLGDFDAQKLSDGFSTFDNKDVQNLGIGEAIVRFERAEFDFNLETLPAPKVDQEIAEERRGQITELSRQQYASARATVEAGLTQIEPEAKPEIPQPKAQAAAATQREQVRSEPPAPPMVAPIEPKTLKALKPPKSDTAALPGRGGREHKYIQQLIQKLAETRGYRASVEESVLNGNGSIDVALFKGDIKIACEICISTSPEHEANNIQKCLAAGNERVLAFAPDAKSANKLKTAVSALLSENALAQVAFLFPAQLDEYLDTIEASTTTKEQTIRGYKVKVGFKASSKEARTVKENQIAEIMRQAFRRLKSNNP